MDSTDLCYLSATELLTAYRARTLSPVEVTRAILERIDRVNPTLNAYVTVTAERAMDDARAAEATWMSGNPTGSLIGVPVSIKDITPTKGIRTTRGSLLYANWVPEEDAPFVEHVYAAGAVMLGKTNTPELGWKGDSGNRVFGPTHNPWKHGRTAGGSSGGAAAAVAAGLGPLASGTDGAGSIRMPAGFCGVFGLKPSFGRLAYYPPSSVESLAHVGPITRTVRDAALLMNITAGADARDRATWPLAEDYLAGCEGGIAGLRVAWSSDLGFAPIDPEVRELTTAAACEARRARLPCRGDRARFARPMADRRHTLVGCPGRRPQG
ncbi:MAG: amidase family protein [Thermomicrobiales bacterium]